MRGADLGLRLALAAFLLALVAPLLPALFLAFAVLTVAAGALLRGDAERRGAAAARGALLGLGLLLGGLLLLSAASILASRAGTGGALPWLALAAQAAVGAGLYLLPQHLAAQRSRPLLGVAFGALVATSAIAAALPADAPQREAALVAQGVPFILFAWAYATILGRLRSEARAGPGTDKP